MNNSQLKMFRFVSFATFSFSAALLSGCVNNELVSDQLVTPAAYSGSAAYPITIVKGPVTLDVDASHGTLEPGQINAVSGFAHQALQAGITPITITRPSGGGASARVASEIAALISQQGVARNMIRIGSYSGPSTGIVHVSYISTYAATKPCGQWTQDATETEDNTHLTSHGCAVQANIAAMIADPESWIVPESSDAIRANTRVNAIKGLEKDTSKSGFSFFNF